MEYLTRDELYKLLTEARRKSERDWLMLLVAYRHGLRASEVVSLNASNFGDDHITLQRLKSGGRLRELLVTDSDPLLDEVEAIKQRIMQVGSGRLFPITRNQLWRLMRQYGAAAGIGRHKLHPHVLKHSIAIHSLPEAEAANVGQYLRQTERRQRTQHLMWN